MWKATKKQEKCVLSSQKMW